MANPLITTRNYILQSVAELKKVTWPSREMTIRYSVLVATISIATAAFFASLDFGLRTGVTALFDRPSALPAAEAPAPVVPDLELTNDNIQVTTDGDADAPDITITDAVVDEGTITLPLE